MSRPLDENTLRQALHCALGETPVGGVRFDAVAAAAHRRRMAGLAGGTTAVAVAGATVAFGLASLAAGGVPAARNEAGGQPVPGVSTPPRESGGPPALPSGSPAGPPSTTASAEPDPTGASGYCPTSTPGGAINWPPIHATWKYPDPRSGIRNGKRIPFEANEVIICRHGTGGALLGAGQVTDVRTVRELRSAVNSATKELKSNPCRIDSMAYVIFTDRAQAVNLNVDLTSCNAWIMPDSTVVEGDFVGRLRELSRTN